MALAVLDPESPLFTDRERAALRLTHAFVKLDQPVDRAGTRSPHPVYSVIGLTGARPRPIGLQAVESTRRTD